MFLIIVSSSLFTSVPVLVSGMPMLMLMDLRYGMILSRSSAVDVADFGSCVHICDEGRRVGLISLDRNLSYLSILS